jgi:hypothetical protein
MPPPPRDHDEVAEASCRRRRVPQSGGGLVDTVGDISFVARSLECRLVSHFREEVYSPECVEEEFSEVYIQHSARSAW